MRDSTRPSGTPRPVIYQLVVRLFGNTNPTQKVDGALAENGCGTFADINERALLSIRALGATHIWLTGALRQATLTPWDSIGLPADHPDVVKGRAGSFYAIRDYYDVCPDYAVDPSKRLAEFDALIGRIHQAGMRVLIDLVPNHVARGYGSVFEPERDFGRGDDQTRFFANQNDFFYLADPPNQTLVLSKPAHWSPAGVTFDGRFDREGGGPGCVPRATGNNVTSPHPSADDSYETVKLNYGYDFVTHRTVFDPPPKVWGKVDHILGYWQARGVDGFRCDFAHYVPKEAWAFLIRRAKERDPESLMIAEAYESHAELLSAGFDALYDFETYNALKRVYLGRSSPRDLARRLGEIDGTVRSRYIEYLENHDERRIASPLVPGASEGETGFGSMQAVKQLGPLSYLYGNGPIIIYSGQEVGEPARGAAGFSGDDGRSTIFDYGYMPELAKWVNDHSYDGAGLSAEQLLLRSYLADLLALAQDPSARGGRYWGLSEDNGAVLSFARFASGGDCMLIVAVNFAMGQSHTGPIRLSTELVEAAGLSLDATYEVRLVLSERGKEDAVIATSSARSLTENGFSLTIPDQSAHVVRVSRPAIGPLLTNTH